MREPSRRNHNDGSRADLIESASVTFVNSELIGNLKIWKNYDAALTLPIVHAYAEYHTSLDPSFLQLLDYAMMR